MGEAGELQEQLCSALCCLAEARMGMAGDVQEIAEACEGLLLRAAQASPSSPEPMQVTSAILSALHLHITSCSFAAVHGPVKAFRTSAILSIKPQALLL